MDAQFWHQRWESNRIGFHETGVSRALADHLGALSLPASARIFLPLCGKTESIGWLLSSGYRVVGAELSELAVKQLFEELGIAANLMVSGSLEQYSADGLEIFVGDIFDLAADTLGRVDAVFDRAALIALPEAMRGSYAAHVTAITRRAPQLLVSLEYDQSLMQGPPFSVTGDEIGRHYRGDYHIAKLADGALDGGVRELQSVRETVWHLTPR